MTKPTEALDTLIIQVAEKRGAAGFTTGDISGYRTNAVDNALRERLVPRGEIFRAKLGHRTVRYFRTEQWAKDYAEGKRVRQATPSVGANVVIRGRAPWPEDTPAYYPTNPDGTPAYKITVAPPPPRALRSNTWSQMP